MAAELLEPPGAPATLEEFLQHVDDNREAWYSYVSQADSQISLLASENVALKVQTLELQRLIKEKEQEIDKHSVKAEIQRENYDRLHQKLVAAETEKAVAISNATAASIPNVHFSRNTPLSTPAENIPAATTLPTPTPAPDGPSKTSRISERIPDPTEFTGDRNDLSRFLDQIRAKLVINRDRFPTPQERMVYVVSRLKDLAYQQIRPYIRFGMPQFSDFELILEILERSFGDPNRASRATQKLHEIRQANREFNTFYAEFQRLALDSGLDEVSLVPILEKAISRELKQLLVTSKPVVYDIHSLAIHLQDLDTRNRYLFGDSSTIVSRNTAAPRFTRSTPPPPSLNTSSLNPVPSYLTTTPKPMSGEPMDLSNHRRYTDKEAGTCFRCHRAGHRVRDCPEPDTRPATVQRRDSDARKYRLHILGTRSPSPPRSPTNRYDVLQTYEPKASRHSTPIRPSTPSYAATLDDDSENDRRLEEVVSRQ